MYEICIYNIYTHMQGIECALCTTHSKSSRDNVRKTQLSSCGLPMRSSQPCHRSTGSRHGPRTSSPSWSCCRGTRRKHASCCAGVQRLVYGLVFTLNSFRSCAASWAEGWAGRGVGAPTQQVRCVVALARPLSHVSPALSLPAPVPRHAGHAPAPSVVDRHHLL